MPNLKVMSEEEFIWDFLNKSFPNDHPIIYLYTCGSSRSSDNATNKALKLCCDVFDPVYSIEYLKEIITIYLDFKKSQFFKGKIQIKSIYTT